MYSHKLLLPRLKTPVLHCPESTLQSFEAQILHSPLVLCLSRMNVSFFINLGLKFRLILSSFIMWRMDHWDSLNLLVILTRLYWNSILPCKWKIIRKFLFKYFYNPFEGQEQNSLNPVLRSSHSISSGCDTLCISPRS